MSGPQSLIGGRYRLIEQIAAGGMGTVWEAWDERLHRRVALKQLHAQPGLGAAEARLANDRAMREARITARLHHAHAVPVYDVVDHDGMPCLIMQYLPSQSLQALLTARGTLSVTEVARIGSEVAAALAAAHRVGIVHRDVKPGNVLIDSDGSAKLTDFGISHALGDITLTSTGFVTGTPAFLAPEVARGIESGFASDVFSLGATLYAAVEGTPPFGPGDNPMAMLHRVASGRINPPRRSAQLTPVLMDMLSGDPANRPSMAQAAAALGAVHAALTDPAASGPTERINTRPTAPQRLSSTANLPVRDPSPGRAPARRSHAVRNTLVALPVLLLVAGAIVLLTQLGGGSGQGAPSTPQAASRARSTQPTGSSAGRTAAAPAGPVSSGHPTSATSPHNQTSTGSTSSGPTSTGAGTADDRVRAVDSYYALLPDNTAAAWDRLTTGYQSQTGGRSNYDSFWHSFRSVEVSSARTRGGLVLVDLRYTSTKGAVSTETRSFQLVRDGGVLKISASSVVPG